MSTVIIKLTPCLDGMPSPYGHLTDSEREYIKSNYNQLFWAKRLNMNYYELNCNSVRVHVYNATEISPR